MDSKRKSVSGSDPDAPSPSKVLKKGSAQIKYLDGNALQAAFEKNVISQWEHGFYNDNLGKEQLSAKQSHFKNLIDFKINMHTAKEKAAITDFEFKFLVDIYGQEEDSLSEKQRPVKQRIDAKLLVWRAFQLNAISDWDLQFMISNSGRETWSAKQQPIKERIERQMEVASAIEVEMLSDREIQFSKDNAGKELSALSEKQRPFMEKIQKKLKAWKACQAGIIDAWQLDFFKDVMRKDNLSEKQQVKLREIEEKLASAA
jgi:hypothetical protein